MHFKLRCLFVFLTLVFVANFFQSQRVAAAQISTVLVGDPGNAADSATGLGRVNNSYRIGKYDVTVGQYIQFLNSVDPTGSNALGLFVISNGEIDENLAATSGSKYFSIAGRQNNPVVYVNWFSALRFVNWLNNGQGNSSTETGAYTLLGGTAIPTNASAITRNAAARWFLPTEDEGYKAAFYKGGNANAGYWAYPTRSNSQPISQAPPGSLNSANYEDFLTGFALTGSTAYVSSTNYLTDVGAFTNSFGPYGTFDQGGDVYQLNETSFGSGKIGYRGGSWNFPGTSLRSIDGLRFTSQTNTGSDVGFRVAGVIDVPEPSSFVTLGLGVITLVLLPSITPPLGG